MIANVKTILSIHKILKFRKRSINNYIPSEDRVTDSELDKLIKMADSGGLAEYLKKYSLKTETTKKHE